jgi:hypothetical protein
VRAEFWGMLRNRHTVAVKEVGRRRSAIAAWIEWASRTVRDCGWRAGRRPGSNIFRPSVVDDSMTNKGNCAIAYLAECWWGLPAE